MKCEKQHNSDKIG